MKAILAPSRFPFATLVIASSWFVASAQLRAQAPDTLQRTIPAPPVGVQRAAELGSAVATNGDLTVVGAPFDDFLRPDAGVVKVFDSRTGELLSILPNPGPADFEHFGRSVAISGTRVVVGAPLDSTGASGAGSAYVYDLSSASPTVPVATLTNPAPASGDNFGNSVAITETLVVVGAESDDAGATDAGSAYVYDLSSGTPTVPVATLNNPGPTSNDKFGNSVAISGTRVVVGALRDDTGAFDAGSAYVYDRDSATPTVPIATLNNPAPGFDDNFGSSVAISGTRVVVGAAGDDTGAFNGGSAYVYDLNSGNPTVPVATLNNPRTQSDFGSSAAISGALVVVGALRDDVGDVDAGSAYVYDLSSDTPTVPARTLNNPDPAREDDFGNAVAIFGTRVVVGARRDDTGALNAGSAYVYDLSSGTPTTPGATLNNPGPQPGDSFGNAVAISGTWVVVGAELDDTARLDAGGAYVYDLSSESPAVPVFALSNPAPSGNLFGSAVAISGMRVVVGAEFDNTGASGAGRAYVYDLSSGSPTVPLATLNNPTPASADNFGNSVAISGTRVVVGAASDDTGAPNAGSAYVYDLNSGSPAVPVATLNNPGPSSGEQFGNSVAILDTWVVVGAPGAGSAYVYNLSSGTPGVPVTTLNNPGPAFADFGSSVAISGTRVVVGAAGDDTGAFNAGRAYVYDLTSETPTVPVVTLNNPAPASSDNFGNAVAISGTRVVVGARVDDAGAFDAGSAYVYDLASGTPTVPVATLNNPAPTSNDQFGNSVAISGFSAVVGAPFDDSPQADKGSAYIYAPALSALSALSRKTHGMAGEFDVALPLTGEPGVESRSGGTNGTHRFVVEFTNAITQGSATVDVGTLSENPTFTERTMTIDVTGVPNATPVTLTLTDVADIFGQTLPSATIPMNVLLGDTNGDETVNSGDALQTRSRAGESLGAGNFRSDVNVDGAVNSGDAIIVRANSGNSLP